MNWLARNAHSVEAAAAVVTAAAAVAALVGVLWQLDSAEDIDAGQAARALYQAHLSMAVNHPDLAHPPLDLPICDRLAAPNGAAYEAFVDHLLFTAQHTKGYVAASQIAYLMDAHSDYICQDRTGYHLCPLDCG